jgi:hypothetical protein
MPVFLHTADWQIGKLFGQFDADEAALLAEERFAAVERIARLAMRSTACSTPCAATADAG